MSIQLYARVFTQILHSSLADDWRTRHIFEDFLKLANNGIVDMTRKAVSRVTNVPLDEINRAIAILEAPDPDSRDPDHEGRRLARIDTHRDWGWIILNWDKYEGIRTNSDERENARERKRRQRDRAKETPPQTPPEEQREETTTTTEDKGQNVTVTKCHSRGVTCHAEREKPKSFVIPTMDELLLAGAKMGLPDSQVEQFYNHYCSNGWKVGKNPMKSWAHSLGGWKSRWQEKQAVSNGTPETQAKAPTAMSGADKMLLMKRLEWIEQRLKDIRNGASHDACGPMWTDGERFELNELKEEKRKLEEKQKAILA